MGRPPTSGYCHTCRKRRIKCDKTQPACLRCIKSGYTCKGYDLGLRMQSFVVVTGDKGSQRLAKVVAPEPETQQIELRPQASGRRSSDDGPQSWKGPGKELPLTAFQENIALSYFFKTYGWSHFWKPFLQLALETDLAPTSKTCSLALAYGHMGLSYGERDLKSMGLELYGQSLREVQTLLTRSDGTAQDKSNLARLCVPIVILGMYSFAVDKDLRLIHNAGVIQILRYCGPEAFQEEPLLTAFRSCRALLICQSFALRRRTFLEEPDWRSLPWKQTPKTRLDRMFDILSQIPGIVNDMAASEHPISPATRDTFRSRITALKFDIELWRMEWHAVNRNCANVVPSNLNLDSVETPVFREILSTQIDFDTVQHGLEILTYNAGLIYCMQLEDVLQMRNSHNAPLTPADMQYIRDTAASPVNSPLLLPDAAKHLCQPALEAFRLVPLLYKNLAASKDRLMVVLAPIGIVYCALQAHAELSHCMKHVLQDIPVFSFGQGALQVYQLELGKQWSPEMRDVASLYPSPSLTPPMLSPTSSVCPVTGYMPGQQDYQATLSPCYSAHSRAST